MRLGMRYRKEAEALPRGYGFTFFDMVTDEVVCHPIPFNLIVALWHRIHMKLARGLRDKWFMRHQEIWRSNFTQGYRQGFEDGKKEINGNR